MWFYVTNIFMQEIFIPWHEILLYLGTTGKPKGVAISHTALIVQSLAKLAIVGYTEEDVCLSWMWKDFQLLLEKYFILLFGMTLLLRKAYMCHKKAKTLSIDNDRSSLASL